MKTLSFASCLLLLFGSLVHAEKEAWDQPLAEMPAHVKVAAGKFSVFADFAAAKEGSPLALYLINDTGKPVVFPSQDGDIFFKQEAKIDGQWVRSQPHRYSWCGNSYYPAPPVRKKHFVRYSANFRGWAPPVEPSGDEKGKVTARPVRYRLYGEPLSHVISNEGEMLVSAELVEVASRDSMALPTLPVETLAALALGTTKISPVDHIDPQMQSVNLLENFPGNEIAQQAILQILEKSRIVDGGENPQERKQIYFRSQALRTVSSIFEPERTWAIYSGIFEDAGHPGREDALRFLMTRVEGREGEKVEILEEILADLDHPLWSNALYLRSEFWEEAELRGKLKEMINDQKLPETHIGYAKGLYNQSFPNLHVRVWDRHSSETGLLKIEIMNISKEPITLTYTHVYDLIESQVEFEYQGEEVPYRSDFKAVVDSERHDSVTKTLEPEELLTFEEVNIWRYHVIPAEFSKDIPYRVISKLPQFGDVPAGTGSTSFYPTGEKKSGAILRKAVEEQRAAGVRE